MDKKLIEKQKYYSFNFEVIPHLSTLRRYALKMTKDYDDSEDLVQDTLLKAFRAFEKYEKGSNVKTWLFKIMKNTFINNYRRIIKQPLKVDYDDVQNFYENINPQDIKSRHYQQDIFANVPDDAVIKAVSVLPDDLRTIVFLCDIEGYTYKEISNFIDCPVGTVRSRLHRTRKILYALLYEYAQKNSYVH